MHEHKHARVAEVELARIVPEEVASIQNEYHDQYGFCQNLFLPFQNWPFLRGEMMAATPLSAMAA